MPVIAFQNLTHYLRTEKNTTSAVWLIHGEEYLCAQALETLLNAFLPDPSDRMNHESLSGGDDQIFAALEKVRTYTFLPGCKIVSLLNSRLFDSKKNTPDLLARARTAASEDNLKGAARYFMRLLGVLALSLEDIAGKNRRKMLRMPPGEDDRWLDPVLAYCRDSGLAVPAGTDKSQVLEDAVTRGFPENHHLIITTDLIDRRRRLYKFLAETGVIVDCAVASGVRQADKTAQEAVLKERMTAILKKHNKQMEPAAFRALVAKTGFSLRTFCVSLEKLVDFIGDRPRIQATDIQQALRRTRQDPIFELTGAVAERHAETSLFFLRSLLSGDLHPLQIIAALANLIRKLAVAREFIDSPHGHIWRPGIQFSDFKRTVMPAVVAYDDEFRSMVSLWQTRWAGNHPDPKTAGTSPGKKKGKKKGKKPAGNQLVLAPNPNSPYPVLKTLENAGRFTAAELARALAKIHAVDLRLKSGEKNPGVLLDQLVMDICRPDKPGRKPDH